MKLNWMPFLALPLLASGLSVAATAPDMVSIHRNSIDTGKMRRSSLDPTFLLA